MPAKPKTSRDPRVSLAISQNTALMAAPTLAAAIVTALGDKVAKDKRGPAAVAAGIYFDVAVALKNEHERRSAKGESGPVKVG